MLKDILPTFKIIAHTAFKTLSFKITIREIVPEIICSKGVNIKLFTLKEWPELKKK